MGPNNSKAGQLWACSQTQAFQTYRLQLNLQTDVASIHEFLTEQIQHIRHYRHGMDSNFQAKVGMCGAI